MESNCEIDLCIIYFFETRLKTCDKVISKSAPGIYLKFSSNWFFWDSPSWEIDRLHWNESDPRRELCFDDQVMTITDIALLWQNYDLAMIWGESFFSKYWLSPSVFNHNMFMTKLQQCVNLFYHCHNNFVKKLWLPWFGVNSFSWSIGCLCQFSIITFWRLSCNNV